MVVVVVAVASVGVLCCISNPAMFYLCGGRNDAHT
jgi:hypothetical protein